MIIRFILRSLTGLLLVVLVLLPTSSYHAQTTSFITEVAASYQFGSELSINGRVDSGSQNNTIYLVLQPERQTSRQVAIDTRDDLTFAVSYNLKSDPLKPFSRIYYWFQSEGADGTVLTTPSYWFDYFDNRFDWNLLESRLFKVYWTGDDTTAGQIILDIAKDGLEKATKILPVAPQLPISIYAFPDQKSLQDSLSSSNQEWVSGHADPALGVVLVSRSADESSNFGLERQVPHELMHILQYQVTGESYGNAPAWLLEGLATYSETYPNPDLDRTLSQALQTKTIIDFDGLCETFPLQANEANIAYAQSRSFVQYLESTYGSNLFIDILSLSGTGLSCEQTMKQTTGIGLAKLTKNWLGFISPTTAEQQIPTSKFVLYFSISLLVIAVIILLIREASKKTINYE